MDNQKEGLVSSSASRTTSGYQDASGMLVAKTFLPGGRGSELNTFPSSFPAN